VRHTHVRNALMYFYLCSAHFVHFFVTTIKINNDVIIKQEYKKNRKYAKNTECIILFTKLDIDDSRRSKLQNNLIRSFFFK